MRDFGFVISSNMLTLLISTMVILIVPKIIGVKEYGYWQLFMFYASYVGLFHFGWLDGIYLRYAGEKYSKLNKLIFRSQFFMLMLLQSVFVAIIISVTSLLVKDEKFAFIMYSISLLLLIIIAQTFFKYVLQITNRISEYAMLTILSNLVYILSVVILLLMNFRDFHVLIGAFIFGNFVATLYGLFVLKDMFKIKRKDSFFWTWKESFLNITVGIQLLMANTIALFILGVVRMGIQHGWGVATFGKVSLTLSISNLLMVFINAISLIIFPKLKRIDPSKVNELYSVIRDILMPLVFVGMLIYFPISYFIPMWLPKYDSALIYMSVLFPMIVYQSKFEILSNTFMKVLRMERQLLFVNIATLIISIILTVISAFVLHNLTATVFVIIIVMAIRSTISELYVKKKLHVKFSSEMLLETTMVVLFIVLSWYLPTIESMIGYMLVLAFYLLIKKNDIVRAVTSVKML